MRQLALIIELGSLKLQTKIYFWTASKHTLRCAVLTGWLEKTVHSQRLLICTWTHQSRAHVKFMDEYKGHSYPLNSKFDKNYSSFIHKIDSICFTVLQSTAVLVCNERVYVSYSFCSYHLHAVLLTQWFFRSNRKVRHTKE